MNRKFKFLTVALVLVVVLLAVFAGSACTANVNADNLATQGRYSQKASFGVQEQGYNAECPGICDGECDGTCQGNCYGEGNCDGDCDRVRSRVADGSCCDDGVANRYNQGNRNGCPGACNRVTVD